MEKIAVIPHVLVGKNLTLYFIIFSHPCVDKENGKTDPDEKSAYRRCWEVYHGASGFIAIAVGFGQVSMNT